MAEEKAPNVGETLDHDKKVPEDKELTDKQLKDVAGGRVGPIGDEADALFGKR